MYRLELLGKDPAAAARVREAAEFLLPFLHLGNSFETSAPLSDLPKIGPWAQKLRDQEGNQQMY